MMTPMHQPDVARAGREERLQRGVGVRLLLPPVPDQHERAQADELPTHEHLQGVVGDDEQQHRRGEQAQRRVVVREAPVAAHVLEGVDVHEQRDRRDDEHHHHGEAVDLDPGAEADAAVLEPRGAAGDRFDERACGRPRRSCDRRCARAAPSAPDTPCVPSASRTRLIHWIAAPTERTNDAPTATTPTSAPRRGMRFPNSRMIANETAGISGTSHAFSRNHMSSATVSPSARRRRRGRRCAGCGRSGARSRARHRLRRPRS